MSTTRGKQKIKIEIKCKKITEAKNRNKLTSVEMSTRVHHESTGAVCRSNGHVTDSEDWEEEDEGWTLKHVSEAWRQHWNHKNFTFLWKIIWDLNLQPTNNSWQFSVCDAAAETFHLRTRKLTACHIRTKKVCPVTKWEHVRLWTQIRPDFDSVWFCCCASVTDPPSQFDSLCCCETGSCR